MSVFISVLVSSDMRDRNVSVLRASAVCTPGLSIRRLATPLTAAAKILEVEANGPVAQLLIRTGRPSIVPSTSAQTSAGGTSLGGASCSSRFC